MATKTKKTTKTRVVRSESRAIAPDHLNTVTTFNKVLAVIAMAALIMIAFQAGMNKQKDIDDMQKSLPSEYSMYLR